MDNGLVMRLAILSGLKYPRADTLLRCRIVAAISGGVAAVSKISCVGVGSSW